MTRVPIADVLVSCDKGEGIATVSAWLQPSP